MNSELSYFAKGGWLDIGLAFSVPPSEPCQSPNSRLKLMIVMRVYESKSRAQPMNHLSLRSEKSLITSDPDLNNCVADLIHTCCKCLHLTPNAITIK